MNTDRPSIRFRGTTEFQGGPLDGLQLVRAYYEKLPLTIEIVFLAQPGPEHNGQVNMMRHLLTPEEKAEAKPTGYYQLSPEQEGGDGQFHWQAGSGRPSGLE